jgi:periplasmic protein TonB
MSPKWQLLAFLLMASVTMAPRRPEGAYDPGAPLSAQYMNAVSPSDQYDIPPKFIRGRAPISHALPLTARERRPSAVVIEFTVGLDGRAHNFRVVSSAGPPSAQLAIEALKHWEFEPGRKRGKPVAVRMRAPFTFDAPR